MKVDLSERISSSPRALCIRRWNGANSRKPCCFRTNRWVATFVQSQRRISTAPDTSPFASSRRRQSRRPSHFSSSGMVTCSSRAHCTRVFASTIISAHDGLALRWGCRAGLSATAVFVCNQKNYTKHSLTRASCRRSKIMSICWFVENIVQSLSRNLTFGLRPSKSPTDFPMNCCFL